MKRIECYKLKSEEDLLRKNDALQRAVDCLSGENPDISSALEILKIAIEHPLTKDEAKRWEKAAQNEMRKSHFDEVMYELVGDPEVERETAAFLPGCEIDVKNCKAGVGRDPHLFLIKCPNTSEFDKICTKWNKEEESFWEMEPAQDVIKHPNPSAKKLKKNDQALFYRRSFVGILRPVSKKQA